MVSSALLDSSLLFFSSVFDYVYTIGEIVTKNYNQ